MLKPLEALEDTKALVDEYLHLTIYVLPEMSKTTDVDWPVTDDHCFQRIVLDNLCQGAWYDFIKAPAYKHLTLEQAKYVVSLCHQIKNGEADLKQLNINSLNWRNQHKQKQGALAL